MAKEFYEIGSQDGTIDVKISYRIIQLFSEGLYSSPNKAVEELVTNSFDAGATDVHVVLSPDLHSDDASITVLDNGKGMDRDGLEQHWLIGESDKRDKNYKSPLKRKQIGQFGIGKLATYVLANRLTHITKIKGKYYSASMNFTKIERKKPKGVHVEEDVSIPFRELTQAEAKNAVKPWTDGSGKGYQALRLFGKGAPKHWTVAIMSDLKGMGKGLQRGRLNWVLRTAMPLRDDFRLFVDGAPIVPSKIAGKQLEHLVIGKDITTLPKPAQSILETVEDKSLPKKSEHHYGLDDSVIGRVTGHIDLYQDPLTGKSDRIGRSYGFFVYVRDRLINADDEYFGIDSNLLRHGTFSRFRMRVNIDALDCILRSSRESVLQGPVWEAVRHFLHGAFNLARAKLKKQDEALTPAARISARIASSPPSLTQWPVKDLVRSALDGTIVARYTRVPEGLSSNKQRVFLREFDTRAGDPDAFITDVVLEDLSAGSGIAAYDAAAGNLLINTLHPFVAYHLDAYEDRKVSLPLELIALGEVLLEAQLYHLNVAPETVNDLLDHRDEVLRYFSHARGHQTPLTVAQELEDSSDDKDRLERALVSAFDSMGFDAVPKGGSNKPDGVATGPLGAQEAGKSDSYKVSLEAKSGQDVNKKVQAGEVKVSGIARNRNKYDCDHAIVVGADFPTQRPTNALVTEIKKFSHDIDEPDRIRTITLMRIFDLARLIRLIPLKRISLLELRGLFETCITPQECCAWVDVIEQTEPEREPVAKILDTIWDEQKEDGTGQVTYDLLRSAVRRKHAIRRSTHKLMEICRSISSVVPDLLRTSRKSVSLHQSPKNVLKAYNSESKTYSDLLD